MRNDPTPTSTVVGSLNLPNYLFTFFESLDRRKLFTHLDLSPLHLFPLGSKFRYLVVKGQALVFAIFSHALHLLIVDGIHYVILPSGKVIGVSPSLLVSHYNEFSSTLTPQHLFCKNRIKNKAGFITNLGFKPKVRGTVKNPCDHPNGGRARNRFKYKTPWSKLVLKEKKNKEKSSFLKNLYI